MSSSFFALIAAGLCGALLYSGCSVDDRVLSPEGSGEPDAGSTGQAGAGHSSGAGGSALPSAGSDSDPGAAGQAGREGVAGAADGGAPSFEGGCADLNHDGTSDCTQTLLSNSTFTSDVSDWLPENGVTITWDALDLLGVANSGSALLTSSGAVDAVGSNLKAATQCVTVHPDKVLEVFANARIDPSAVDGAAALSLWFFPLPNCPGDSPSEVYLADQMASMGETLTLHGTQAVPIDMVSLRLRLSVIKPFKADNFSVRFDNLLLVER